MVERVGPTAGYRCPDYGRARRVFDQLRERYRGRFREIDAVLEMREFRYEAALGEMSEEERERARRMRCLGSPKYSDFLDRTAGLVSSHVPMFSVAPMGDDDGSRRAAGYEERALNAVFWSLGSQQSREEYYRLVDSVVAYGVACASLLPDASVVRAMGEGGERGDGEGCGGVHGEDTWDVGDEGSVRVAVA